MCKCRLILILLALYSCQKENLDPPAPIYPVKTTLSKQKEASIFIETLGHVDSITAIQIKSRIEGELTGVYFTQGQEVLRGDLLFTIDSRPYEAALKEAKAQLDENLANLALAEEKVKRYRILAKDEYYSQIDYETLQADYAANAALVEQNRAQVDTALINLNYCWIYAPIDGMTGLLQVDFGNLVADNGNILTTLNQMAPIYVTFSIPEHELYKVQKVYRKEDPLKVIAAYENFSDEVFTGKLFMIDNSVNADTGMITLRAIFENEKRELWPGQFIRTRLILKTMPDAIVIPYAAIQLTQDGAAVFVVRGNQVEQRAVILGQREDGNVIVLKGLEANETIVVEGQLNLYDGAKVEVKP